eukprot:g68609.t1
MFSQTGMSFLRVVSLATIATALAIDQDQKVLSEQDQQVLSGSNSLSLLKKQIDTAPKAPAQHEDNLALVSETEGSSACRFYQDCTTCLGIGAAFGCIWTITADPALLFNPAAGSCRPGPCFNGATCGSFTSDIGTTVRRYILFEN